MRKTRLLIMVVLGMFMLLPGNLYAGGSANANQLCKMLVDLPGWKGESCQKVEVSQSPMGQMVQASRSYTKGVQTLRVMLMSGMKAMAMWAPFSTGMKIENDTNLLTIKKINGFQAGISYDKVKKEGGIFVFLFKNPQAAGQKAIFVVNFEKMDWQKALDMAKKFDWEKMAGLFAP